jgi:hypothetical protein
MRVGSSEPAEQEQASNHLELLAVNAVGGERRGKRCGETASGVIREDERK